MIFTATCASPIGRLALAVDDHGRLLHVDLGGELRTGACVRLDEHRCSHVLRQLREYFAGERRQFELELVPTGTPFQLRAWRTLRSIPFGTTWSYQQQARCMGQPTAMRAVGAANGRNPIPIVVPCHRVVGKDGSLVGFGGGLDKKRWLLEHEAAVLTRATQALAIHA